MLVNSDQHLDSSQTSTCEVLDTLDNINPIPFFNVSLPILTLNIYRIKRRMHSAVEEGIAEVDREP